MHSVFLVVRHSVLNASHRNFALLSKQTATKRAVKVAK